MRREAALWTALALFVMVAALASIFHGVWSRGRLSDLVPIAEEYRRVDTPSDVLWKGIIESDQRLTAWTISRNARVLLTRPWNFFHAETCFPARSALALGEHVLSLGVLAVPFYVVTGDPVATSNLAVLALFVLAGLAMYWLVRDWTGVPAAGIVAGLVFAFHSSRLRDFAHPYIYDNVWTVLALIFARRLFVDGRWRDAIATAICVVLQLGSSFYAVVGAGLLAAPLLAWLVWSYGLRALRPAQVGVMALIIVAGAVWLFGPYLEMTEAAALSARPDPIFRSWRTLLPPAPTSSGWLCLALSSLALVLGGRRALGAAAADVRWALLGAGFLVAWAASGPSFFAGVLESKPNLYGWLSALLPGLDAVRAPGKIQSGLHLALCVLAGLGAAALVRLGPRRLAPYVGAALILVAYLDVVRPAFLGGSPKVVYQAVPIAPEAADLELFRQLEALGNTGPLVELPVDAKHRLSSVPTLANAYHGRPTSACYNSFEPPASLQVRDIALRLPNRDAIAALRQLGFSTIIVHHPQGSEYWRTLGEPLQQLTLEEHPPIRWLVSRGSLTAFEILPVGGL